MPRNPPTRYMEFTETVYLDNDIYKARFSIYEDPDVGLDGLVIESVNAIKGSPEPSESDIDKIRKILSEDLGYDWEM